MPESTMRRNLLQPLQVFTQLAVQPVRYYLGGRPFMDVLPSVEEPAGDAVAFWVLDDSHDLFDFLLSQLPCALV